MSEDCLTLNVVAPEAGPSDEPLPVMFFIHGGGYILGSSATPIYDGAALARRGCVYVSVNYRLGALGCMDLSALSTPEYPIEDNLFLRDLVMALRWVRDNVAVFGGDPDNVTDLRRERRCARRGHAAGRARSQRPLRTGDLGESGQWHGPVRRRSPRPSPTTWSEVLGCPGRTARRP